MCGIPFLHLHGVRIRCQDTTHGRIPIPRVQLHPHLGHHRLMLGGAGQCWAGGCCCCA